jgi:hypothetical protein
LAFESDYVELVDRLVRSCRLAERDPIAKRRGLHLAGMEPDGDPIVIGNVDHEIAPILGGSPAWGTEVLSNDNTGLDL